MLATLQKKQVETDITKIIIPKELLVIEVKRYKLPLFGLEVKGDNWDFEWDISASKA